MCKKQFDRHDNLIRHRKDSCNELYKDEFFRGIQEHKHDENIMKKILRFSNSNKSFMFPYFAVYDFESIAEGINKNRGERTVLLNKQKPISYSLGSNVPGFEVFHVVDYDTKKLIKSLIDNIRLIQEKAYEKVVYEYLPYIDKYCIKME